MFGNLFGKNKKNNEATREKSEEKKSETFVDSGNDDGFKNEGSFLSFVLLEDNKFDFEKYKKDVFEKWDIKLGDADDEKDTYVCNIGDIMVAISLNNAPIPNGEAEHFAKTNYMWPGGENEIKKHKAHILISVLGKGGSIMEKALLFVKLNEMCCHLDNVLGVYVNDNVYQPELYRDFASSMDKNDDEALPLLNLVWIGLWMTSAGGTGNAYTSGLNAFGKDEMEIVDVKEDLSVLQDVMLDLITYILTSDATLLDGQTIGFSADQKWTITRSKCLFKEGMSLKIGYTA